MKRVAVSGYFDPIHIGHLEYLKLAKELGDKLVVIVNNNYQCALKKGKPFMDESDRVEIVRSLEMVDEVFLSIDKALHIRQRVSHKINYRNLRQYITKTNMQPSGKIFTHINMYGFVFSD